MITLAALILGMYLGISIGKKLAFEDAERQVRREVVNKLLRMAVTGKITWNDFNSMSDGVRNFFSLKGVK